MDLTLSAVGYIDIVSGSFRELGSFLTEAWAAGNKAMMTDTSAMNSHFRRREGRKAGRRRRRLRRRGDDGGDVVGEGREGRSRKQEEVR